MFVKIVLHSARVLTHDDKIKTIGLSHRKIILNYWSILYSVVVIGPLHFLFYCNNPAYPRYPFYWIYWQKIYQALVHLSVIFLNFVNLGVLSGIFCGFIFIWNAEIKQYGSQRCLQTTIKQMFSINSQAILLKKLN